MLKPLNLPAPVRLLLLCNGTPAGALHAVHRSAKDVYGYKIHSYVRGHTDRLPQLGTVVASLQEIDVILFAPGAASLENDSQVQLFEENVLKAALCQSKVIPIVLYLIDWKYAKTKHVSWNADKVVHVITLSSVGTNGGASDVFPYAGFTQVPGDAPGTMLEICRKVSRPPQSCCT